MKGKRQEGKAGLTGGWQGQSGMGEQSGSRMGVREQRGAVRPVTLKQKDGHWAPGLHQHGAEDGKKSPLRP